MLLAPVTEGEKHFPLEDGMVIRGVYEPPLLHQFMTFLEFHGPGASPLYFERNGGGALRALQPRNQGMTQSQREARTRRAL